MIVFSAERTHHRLRIPAAGEVGAPTSGRSGEIAQGIHINPSRMRVSNVLITK